MIFFSYLFFLREFVLSKQKQWAFDAQCPKIVTTHNERIVEQFSLQAVPFTQVPGHSDSINMCFQVSEKIRELKKIIQLLNQVSMFKNILSELNTILMWLSRGKQFVPSLNADLWITTI
jgi:hypothetical protein